MRIVVQRVTKASVTVNGEVVGAIKKGLTLLVGCEPDDDQCDIDWLVGKVTQLRIFNDEQGKMNLCISDVDGDFLVISQFTLYAATKKGNRPSYARAAKPKIANECYSQLTKTLENVYKKKVQKGVFGADMKLELLNDGPVTIIMDSKNKNF